MSKFEEFVDKTEKVVEKAGDKLEEVKNSEKTKAFVEKAKDTAIHVGVKVTDVVEELGNRAKEAMHNTADKRAEEKAAAKKAAEDAACADEAEKKKVFSDVVEDVKDAAEDAAETVKDAAEDIAEKVQDAVDD